MLVAQMLTIHDLQQVLMTHANGCSDSQGGTTGGRSDRPLDFADFDLTPDFELDFIASLSLAR